MHRFFLREGDFVRDGVFEVHSAELIHQWRNVLKFRMGEKVVLFGGDGKEFECIVESVRDRDISGSVSHIREPNTELPFRLILASAITKQMEKLEWVLQKGTELGASDFFPLVTKRTERDVLPKIERLNRIVIEASEQSGRVCIPQIHSTTRLDDFFTKMFHDGVHIVLPHTGARDTFSSFLRSGISGGIAISIGPEGGFIDDEVTLAREKGVHVVSLGSRILRAETAAIVSAALVGQMRM